MKFKGVIFDLDGTLADTLEDLSDAMNRVLSSKGFPARSYDEYKYIIGKGIRNLVTNAIPEDKRNEEIVSECFNMMISDYSENCLVKTKLYNGIAELIEILKDRNVKLAVFSNKADDLTVKITDHLSGLNNFEMVLGAKTGMPAKPDPSGALLIADRFQISPQNILYLGDTGIDMITANRAGMYAIGAAWGFRTKEELFDNGARAAIDHPLDLFELRISD